jgi:hypothetical protein
MIGGGMSKEEKYAEAEKQFNGLDYNNQRNLLLFIQSTVLFEREEGTPDPCPHCPYHDYSFVCDVVGEQDVEKIKKMVDLITRKGIGQESIKLQELLEEA